MSTNKLIRQFERLVYAWPLVTRAKDSAYGEHTYKADKKVFAYFEGENEEESFLVLYRTTQAERQELAELYGARPHQWDNREERLWWSVPVNETRLLELEPYIRRCYERAIKGIQYSE